MITKQNYPSSGVAASLQNINTYLTNYREAKLPGSKGGDNGQLIQYKSYHRKGMKSSLIQ